MPPICVDVYVARHTLTARAEVSCWLGSGTVRHSPCMFVSMPPTYTKRCPSNDHSLVGVLPTRKTRMSIYSMSVFPSVRISSVRSKASGFGVHPRQLLGWHMSWQYRRGTLLNVHIARWETPNLSVPLAQSDSYIAVATAARNPTQTCDIRSDDVRAVRIRGGRCRRCGRWWC